MFMHFRIYCFFLPLIVNKDSKLGRFYANQGLLFLLTSLGIVFVNILLAFVPFFRNSDFKLFKFGYLFSFSLRNIQCV